MGSRQKSTSRAVRKTSLDPSSLIYKLYRQSWLEANLQSGVGRVGWGGVWWRVMAKKSISSICVASRQANKLSTLAVLSGKSPRGDQGTGPTSAGSGKDEERDQLMCVRIWSAQIADEQADRDSRGERRCRLIPESAKGTRADSRSLEWSWIYCSIAPESGMSEIVICVYVIF